MHAYTFIMNDVYINTDPSNNILYCMFSRAWLNRGFIVHSFMITRRFTDKLRRFPVAHTWSYADFLAGRTWR